MRLFTLAVLVGINALSAAQAYAEQAGSKYMHNGSLMRVYWDDEGDGMAIRYLRPKTSLGVKAGTTLFRGAMTANGRTYGRAFVFKDGCTPAQYQVEGKSIGNDIVLTGKAPFFGDDCEVLGYATTGHSTLKFTLVE